MKTVKELMSLDNRVAIVTGGAGHIGSVFCETLAEIGASVAVLDLNPEKCVQVAERIAIRSGNKAYPLSVDLANEKQIQMIPEKVLAQFGRIDILVNCAAFVGTSDLNGWAMPFSEQSAETWRMALEINLTAVFVLIQKCVEPMKKSGKGSIVNVGSIYGIVGPDLDLYEGTNMGNPAAYAASKGGLLQFTKWLSTVLAPEIRVNAITPGGVWRNQPDSFLNKYIGKTPLQRMATEEELKGALAYLSSDLSAYVTGQNLVVDGGFTIW